MSYVDPSYSPIKGVNFEDAETSLDPGQVADTLNMLYENREVFNRPGIVATPMTGPLSASFLWAKGLIGAQVNVLVDNAGVLKRLASGAALTTLTGVATTFGSRPFFNATTANGIALIGNNTDGLIRWDYTGGVAYTVIADAPYRYVKGILARAVAAYKLTGAATDPITFAWSAPGDETLWTGSTNGSGSLVIADATDEVTGLEILRNVAVVIRTTGIHLAVPTGVSLPLAFQMQTFNSDDIGSPFPSTICSRRNVAFFVGQDDVYTFDLSKLTPIGRQIRSQLFPYLEAGTPVIGFTTLYTLGTNSRRRPKLRYHLVVVQGNAKHFCYSVEDDTWSVHDYFSAPIGAAFDKVSLINALTRDAGFTLIDGSSNFYTWDSGLACERSSYFKGPAHTIGSEEMDVNFQRALLKARNYGDYNVTLSMSSRIGKTSSALGSVAASIGNATNDGYYCRTWFDSQGSAGSSQGQTFQSTFTVPANKRFCANYYSLRTTDGGEYRG